MKVESAKPVNAKLRTCGFRFSRSDAVAIALALLGTVALWSLSRDLALLMAAVPAHFFLFCNVFRIHRRLEYAWSGVFVVNVAAHQLTRGLVWWQVILVQAPVTLSVLVVALRSRSYHGVFARVINARYIDLYLNEELDR
jgi:hypothetical protein